MSRNLANTIADFLNKQEDVVLLANRFTVLMEFISSLGSERINNLKFGLTNAGSSIEFDMNDCFGEKLTQVIKYFFITSGKLSVLHLAYCIFLRRSKIKLIKFVSASKLSSASSQDLIQGLREKYGNRFVLDCGVSFDLISGSVLLVESYKIDSSTLSKLRSLRNHLSH